MKLFALTCSQRLPLALEEAWDFFSNPGNLQEITPPDMKFEVTSVLPERMYAGLIVTYRVRPVLGIPMNWVTEITQVAEPHLFVDEQRFGPYRFWHHQHHFREVDGGVEMQDVVHYAFRVPFPGLVNTLLVRRRLEGIFEFRRGVLEQKFGILEPGA